MRLEWGERRERCCKHGSGPDHMEPPTTNTSKYFVSYQESNETHYKVLLENKYTNLPFEELTLIVV